MPETTEQNLVPANDAPTLKRRRGLGLFMIVLSSLGSISMIVSVTRVSALSTETQESSGDFSKFYHTQTHAALPCLLCHRRENNSPRPSLPGHTPCAGCHTQRFTDSRDPMCTICHTEVQSGAVKSFPRLRSFNVRFDHGLHATGAARPGAGCATCHQPARRGVALSIPAGFSAHATCYQCHAPSAQASTTARDISSCSTCHSQGRHVRTSTFAKAYKVNFSHAGHGARQRLSCNDCHSIRAGMPRTKQVTAPQSLMHHASARAKSCATCHNDKRAFGIESFGDCIRCHQGAHFYF